MQLLIRFTYPLVLFIVFAVFFFAGLDGPTVIDYDEGVYAEVSREMYLGGEILIPRLNDSDFFEKPPLLYWLQMLGYDLFGITSLGARAGNALCGLLLVLVVYFGARRPLGDRTALYAALILGSSIISVYLARIAMTDMALTLFLTLCLIVSWRGVERELQQRSGAPLFWLGCLFAGLAMLSKGAIGALFPLLTAVCYLFSIRRPGLLWKQSWLLPGGSILILVGFSWYLGLGFFHPEGFSFMRELFVEHHLSRFTAPMEGHSGPFYFYLIVLLVGFVPWFAFLPQAVTTAPLTNHQAPADRFVRLFVIFSGLVFIFFSVAATKLPNYILPALPGLAVALAVLFNRDQEAVRPIWRWSAWLSAATILVLGLLFLALPVVFPYLHEMLGKDARKAPILAEGARLGWSPWLLGAAFLVSAYLVFRVRAQRQRRVLFETLLVVSLLISGALLHIGVPFFDRLMNAPLARIARLADDLSPKTEKIVLFAIDDRPSINFVSGRFTDRLAERDYQRLPDLFPPSTERVGITTVYYRQRLHSLGIATDELARDGGYVLFRIATQTMRDSSAHETHQETADQKR